MGTAVSINLPEELNARLEEFAKRTGRSKDSYLADAISEKLEDLLDLYEAEQVTRDLIAGRSSTVSQDEMERRYGISD